MTFPITQLKIELSVKRLARASRALGSQRGFLACLLGGLLGCALLACDEEEAPSPAEPAANTVESEPEAASVPSEEDCDTADQSLANFDCLRASLCAGTNRADDVVSLVEALCVVDDLAEGEPLSMGQVVAALPLRFQKNYTLKHGTREQGLRGHIQEVMAEIVSEELAKNSQSADLDFPRVILWDETTGFTLSYNGGLAEENGNRREQTGANRLDLLGFDRETKEFELWALPIPVGTGDGNRLAIRPFRPDTNVDNCSRCHGPRSRPIWPMYPDWPGFYGSDNDELTQGTEHQRVERQFLSYFRRCVTSGNMDADGCDDMRPSAAPQAPEASHSDTVDTRERYPTLFSQDLATHFDDLFAASDRQGVRDYIIGLEERYDEARQERYLTPRGRTAVHGDDSELQAWLGLELHSTFPYRPNHEDKGSEPSRAFFHRPNLRLGVLYNRLVALNVFEHMREQEIYQDFRKHYAFLFMDCGISEDGGEAFSSFRERTSERLSAVGMSLGDLTAQDHRVLYPALLATLGLKVRDVDIRYTYVNRRFDRFDTDYIQPNRVSNIMALGYLPYRGTRDYNQDHGADLYFNSYFDGSATTNELLLALILEDLATHEVAYRERFVLRTLETKYRRFASRWVLDEPFFTEMDELTGWFPLPFPHHVEDEHHRESFFKRIQGRMPFREQQNLMCEALWADLASGAPR